MLVESRRKNGADRTIPSTRPTQQLRAFTGDPNHGATAPVRGNPCLIHLTDAAPAHPPVPATITQCVTWPGQAGIAHVRCWTPTSKEIQLCGHGLLCCASYWQDQPERRPVLVMNGLEVHCEQHGGFYWLALPTIETHEIPVPDWASTLLGAAPEYAAEAGPADGYLVLAMEADCDIASLAAPGDALATHTGRSLIVTRRVSAETSLCGETIQYRYFAPQHGVPEDTATGSAMRVVAAYWQARGAGSELQALQRSAGGGWLQSRVENDRTWIGGRIIEDRNAA
jgi:predicted PhzF superfamily epimerase YddE/YHI9